LAPPHPADYDQIGIDFRTTIDELQKVQARKKAAKNPDEIHALEKEESELALKKRNLKDLQDRIVTGWKMQQARATKALPEAFSIAKKIIESNNDPEVIRKSAEALNKERITLPGVSEMHQKIVGANNFFKWYYSEYPLPKDKIVYPREDMVKQIVSLYDLKKEIVVKETDPRKEKEADAKY